MIDGLLRPCLTRGKVGDGLRSFILNEECMLKRMLLIMEILILCGPALYLLCIGVVAFPSFVFMTIAGDQKGYLWSLMIFSGVWGLISLTSVASHVISGGRRWPGRPIQWFGVGMGFTACTIGLFISFHYAAPVMLVIFPGPIVVAVHLLYLSKNGAQATWIAPVFVEVF